MKKFLALGLLGISHACDPTSELCVEDSNGYIPAAGKTITNLVLTKITSADAAVRGYSTNENPNNGDPVDIGKYGISKCTTSTGPKTWGNVTHGNVVECVSVYSTDVNIINDDNLATGLRRKLISGDPNSPSSTTDIHRILEETNAMCNSLATTECDVAGYTGALIAGATCASTVCDATDVTTCCVSKFTVGTSSLARTKMMASLSSKLKGARLDWSTDNNDATSFTAAERREAVKLIADGEKIKYEYEAGAKKRTAIGRIRKDKSDAKIKQTKGETIEFPVYPTAQDDDHVCVELGVVGDVCFTITLADLGDPILGTFGSRRRLSDACFQGSQLTSEGDNIYSFNGAFNASNKCAITETVDSEGASQYEITNECNSNVTTDIQDSGTFSPWTTTPATTTSTTCGYCHAAKVSGCTYCAEGLGLDGTACVSCGGDDKFNSIFDHTACGACPAGSTSNDDNDRCTCNAGYYGPGVTHESNDCHECTSIEHAATVQCTTGSDQKITTCDAGYYKTGNTCTECTTCGTGKRQTTACSSDTNRVCAQNICSCTNGVAATGAACTIHGAHICTSCSGEYYKTGNTCTGCTTCGTGKRQTTACSSASNRFCTQNVCSCTNGVAAALTACTTHDDNICSSCTGEYYKTGNTCTAWSTCPQGEFQSTAPNATDNRKCDECPQHTYQNNHAFTGTACTPCDPNSDSCTKISKGECKAGYSGDGASCTQCDIGKFKSDVANGDCTDCIDPSPGVVGDYTSDVGQSACKSCSGFSTEWINSQCCGKTGSALSDQCTRLNTQCGVSC